MVNTRKTIFKDSIKYGIILGLILIITSIIIYVFDIMTISLWMPFIIIPLYFVLYLIVLLVLMKNYREKVLGGFMKYGRGLVFAIIVGVYASVIITAFTYSLHAFIDPNYQKNAMEKMANMTADKLYELGVDDAEIEKAIEKMEKQKDATPEQLALGAISGPIIMSFFVSLIAAAFIKRKKDPFESAMEGVQSETVNTQD